ncbi:hypothetical protein BAX97_15225 [Elizabethkingia meningoseptica]|jgi:hypothetical protein|nr:MULTISPECIES: hypothetical protein [Elizabethkingia]AQX05296.1 hypothetical protein BBD33_08565 [Elizabethkingia meningoseptica]AQX47339.1 hypothetical protein B5G46_08555 [Elizabethkingia meningoseptica]AQX90614.1 hypothetical protein AYC67_17045 [Elizabethkingia anophelis]EHM7981766.1 hypothetical protein [Elizabethkingia anophelis]EHM8032264.1 hypothetical protein [Elizabethkingia anophelis]
MHSTEIQTKIDQLKVMPPNYTELSATWESLISQKLREQFNSVYKDVALTDQQLKELADLNIQKYKSSISEEEYRKELDEIHRVNIDSAVKQLEIMKNEALRIEQAIDIVRKMGINIFH